MRLPFLTTGGRRAAWKLPARSVGWFGLFGCIAASSALADPVQVYAAGSLSGVMGALIEQSGQSGQDFATPVFGPAGLLGERLRKGEKADLFASADLAAPERVASVRPDTLVTPFARIPRAFECRRPTVAGVKQRLASIKRMETS